MQTKQTCCCCCCSHICKHVELNFTVYNIFQYFDVNSRKHKSPLKVLKGPSNNDWNLFPEALAHRDFDTCFRFFSVRWIPTSSCRAKKSMMSCGARCRFVFLDFLLVNVWNVLQDNG